VKRSTLQRAVRTGIVAGAALSSLAISAPAAHAADPVLPVPLTLAGADASFGVVNDVFKTTANVYNIPAAPTAAGYLTPAKAHSPQFKWILGTTPGVINTGVVPNTRVAPNGAGAGLELLRLQETDPANYDSIDIVRSSNAPRGNTPDANGKNFDPVTFEYYAFALDAVGWASTSLNAPATLSNDDLKKIYNCTYTDWSQVPGGGVGPIRRYEAQNTSATSGESGTWTFFYRDLLGGTNANAGTTIPHESDTSGGACLPVGHTEQSTATFTKNQSLPSSISNLGIEPADYQSAIFLYSSAVWSYQANNSINPTIDKRNGARIGSLSNATQASANTVSWDAGSLVYTLNTAGPVTEANVKVNNPAAGFYPGIRYQYFTIDSWAGNANYDAAKAIVGFKNVPTADPSPGKLPQLSLDGTTGIASDVCNGNKRSPILSSGFAPLSRADVGGHNVAHSTCRLFSY